jgi:Flp pilus assembly protein TadG
MDTFVSRFRRFRRRFVKDERGAVAIFLAAGMITLVGVVGLGVDTIRGYLVQSRLSAALDAAGLAGARVMYSPTRDQDIQMFFNANFPPGFMGATITGPTIATNSDNSKLTLTASANLDTTFMRALGINTLNVASTSEITREVSMLEVVLAIDISGSMGSSVSGGGSRIDAARTAALSLTDILFGANAISANLQVALVPWNGKVNVGLNGVAFDATSTPPPTTVTSFTNPLTGATQNEVYLANNSPVPLLAPPPADWRGCVFQRYTDDSDDDNDADRLIGGISIGGADWPAWEAVKTYNPGAGEPISGGTCGLQVDGNECTPCPSEGITDLTSTRSVIDASINQLTNPGGYTNAVQGMVWAWQVLMPTPPFTGAFAPPGPNIQRKRAIVLLTDGEQTGRSGDGYKAAFGSGTSAQGDLTDNMMNQRLNDLATAIKNQGILIYSIQFANTSGSLADLLKSVSTGPASPFYSTADSQQALNDVFKEIANDLAELHVSM